MLFHNLGNDAILICDLFLEFGNPLFESLLGSVRFPFNGDGAVLKEFHLPFVEYGRVLLQRE